MNRYAIRSAKYIQLLVRSSRGWLLAPCTQHVALKSKIAIIDCILSLIISYQKGRILSKDPDYYVTKVKDDNSQTMVDTLTDLALWADTFVLQRNEPEDTLQDNIEIININALGGERVLHTKYLIKQI